MTRETWFSLFLATVIILSAAVGSSAGPDGSAADSSAKVVTVR
jgi:hypothetical protein